MQNAAFVEALSIGDRIRLARKDAGLSQADLAVKVGVSQPSVANWESGVHDPRRLMLGKIAGALKVSPEWLASGARSPVEADKQAAAAYLRRPLRHTPIIALEDAARFLSAPDADPHAFALDYIPVTTGAERVFAFFVNDEAVNRAFPTNTLVVIDCVDRQPADGGFALYATDDLPVIRRWNAHAHRLETCSDNPNFADKAAPLASHAIGCVRVSIRFH
jgi:transcriptional regulator with XRE-family HTH domain